MECMKKLLAVGVIVLFLGLAIAPSINANIGELSVDIPQENDTLQLESEFQRIKAYIEMKSDEDCGCDDANTTGLWFFPVICLLLYPLLIFSFGLLRIFEIEEPYITMVTIGMALNCLWI